MNFKRIYVLLALSFCAGVYPISASANDYKTRVSLCRYTTDSDYYEPTDGYNIKQGHIDTISIEVGKSETGCYVYYVEASPGTYLTAYHNRQRNVYIRWSTRAEIQTAQRIGLHGHLNRARIR
jgi:hypothetical protein